MENQKSEPRDLASATVISPQTIHCAIQAPDVEFREWLEDAPVCEALAAYHIIHCGTVSAVPPYRFVRTRARATELLVCLEGAGRFLLDGSWVDFGPSMAALMPQFSAAGYEASGPGPWRLAWVCYLHQPGEAPLTTSSSPVLAEFDGVALLHALNGLRHECNTTRDDAHMHSWAGLIHKLVLRFAQPANAGDRFAALWEKVAQAPDRDWALDDLARESGCCREVLRKRCQQELGRSPMQHVTYIRLQRAASLLSTTNEKVESIAAAVGYEDPYTFSAMFKRWTGVPPSEFRDRAKLENAVRMTPTALCAS